MKKILLTLTIGILLASCSDKKAEIKAENSVDFDVTKNVNEAELKYVDRWNQIELSHTDDKYGEWGGDTDIILVYSDGKNYYAKYAKYLGSYEPPEPPKENEEIKKWYEYKKLERGIDSIELNSEQIELIETSILELTKLKINSKSSFSHSGIVNRVISRDSSLIIEDYPSNKWSEFQKLKNSIMNK
ncbi:hypothetical protein [Marixanthomonas spongiae]|uniref:Uncharacterized protein n=1 Tax=Marixanthomonas spongiae TaxID=2174845 RepID=A0A2U0HXJ5_9FLAO|nr:hypothetical protein [Marixanthomonas spongiae]PVW13548.1 hypothetical protein DDV96_12890 [Marixanthomonas spongiae]